MAAKPNILIFFVDQQRGDSVPPYSRAITPSVGRLAKEGVTFANTFCPSPHCSPSRATFWTGLYPSQHGVWNNVSVGNALSRGLFDGVKCWTEHFDPAEYRLRTHGKWHVSAYQSPSSRGFENDDGFGRPAWAGDGFSLSAPAPPFEWDRHRREAREKPEGATPKAKGSRGGRIDRSGYCPFWLYGDTGDEVSPGRMVERAVEFLSGPRDPEQSWVLHVGTGHTHDPYFAPKPFVDLYRDWDIELPASYGDTMDDKPALYRRTRRNFDKVSREEHIEAIRHYLACCSYVDYQFGVVLDALEKTGEADNTVVIYVADHGDYMAEHGLWAKGLPCFRGAYHVPCVIRWPAGVNEPGRVVNEFVSLADFAPTLLEVAGYKADQALAGRSLVPFLRGEPPADWRTEMHLQSNGNELYGIQRAVVTDRWKLVYNGFDFDELYDLENDPDERVNVFGRPENAGVIRELYAKLWRFAYEHDDVCVNEYIMVALAEHGPGVIFEAEA